MEQMRNKETVIFGGAFNPPTLAHLAIFNACIEYAENRNADVWLLPSGDRTDKVISVPREVRIAYLDAMIHDAKVSGVRPEIITSELDRDTLIETYDTVQELKGAYPNRTFRFVFGADSTETMASWNRGQQLLEELPMLVVPRLGSSINPAAHDVILLDVETPDISSTQVRTRLAQGAAVKDLVGASVALMLQ